MDLNQVPPQKPKGNKKIEDTRIYKDARDLADAVSFNYGRMDKKYKNYLGQAIVSKSVDILLNLRKAWRAYPDESKVPCLNKAIECCEEMICLLQVSDDLHAILRTYFITAIKSVHDVELQLANWRNSVIMCISGQNTGLPGGR